MSELHALAARIAALPRPLLVALDVDGTLAPITIEAQHAIVPAATVRAVRALMDRPQVAVALVTGRDAAGLGRMIRFDDAWRAVEHGRRILKPGEPPRAREASDRERGAIESFASWVERELVPRGAQLERKDGAAVVHVRTLLETRRAADAETILARARERAIAEGLHARDGRAVLEAELEPGDKGSAVRALLAQTGAVGCVYFGDDVTDEPAIAAAAESGGLGVFVRSAERATLPAGANASVDGPDEVRALLEAVADQWFESAVGAVDRERPA